MQQKQLSGKVIVVTGGIGVLGYAFNKALANAGAAIGIMGRNEKIARQRVAAAIEGHTKWFAVELAHRYKDALSYKALLAASLTL